MDLTSREHSWKHHADIKYKLSSHNGDYVVNIYYLHNNMAEIIIRRVDSVYGWGFMEITLFNDDTSETFDIGSSKENHKTVKITTTSITLQEIYSFDTRMPKTIMQTKESKICSDSIEYNTVMSIIETNPEYDYVFFDQITRREFIKKHFTNNVLLAYDYLVPGAYQADLFRYCYLYIRGGCYLDLKMICRKPLRDIIAVDDHYLLCLDYEKTNSFEPDVGTSYLNSLIMTVPRNELFLDMINACVDNILNKQAEFLNYARTGQTHHILDLTGPTLFYKIAKPNIKYCNLRFKHIIVGNNEHDYKNFQICDVENKELFFTKTYKTYNKSNHYSVLWNKGELFFLKSNTIRNWNVYLYPYPYGDKFDVNLGRNKVCITRIDKDEGWWTELKIKIVSDNTNETYGMSIGRHYTFTKTLNCDMDFSRDLPANVFNDFEVNNDSFDINKDDSIIAITSVIHVSNNPLLGVKSRSVFSGKERLAQTILQLHTIKEKMPNSKIIILESSIHLSLNDINNLSSLCDYMVMYNNKESRHYCHNEYHNKGLGEIYPLIQIGHTLKNKNFKHFYKFGGRYKFSDDFDPQEFTKSVPCANCIKGNGRLGILAYPAFYGIPRKYYNLYYEHMRAWFGPNTREPTEHILTMFLESVKDIYMPKKMGIEGYGATDGKYNIL